MARTAGPRGHTLWVACFCVGPDEQPLSSLSAHALELSRYLHLNPTRAGIVERPEEWAWSSYPDYLAMRKAPAWLDWQTVVGELGKDLARARPAYRPFMEAGLREPPKSPLATALGGMFLGSAEWVEWWRRRLAAEPVRECLRSPSGKTLAATDDERGPS